MDRTNSREPLLQLHSTPVKSLALREKYLCGLLYAQELFVESLVQRGEAFFLSYNGKIVGYLIKNGEILVETFVESDSIHLVHREFLKLIQKLKILSAYCKSFDSISMNLCKRFAISSAKIGVLYRTFAGYKFLENPLFHIKFAAHSDAELVEKFEEGFFDSIEEIRGYVDQDGLFILLEKDVPVAAGLLKRILPFQNAFDVGMVVAKMHRNKGLGSYIVSYLANYCLRQGWSPICGCDVNNIASQRAIKNAGFYSQHSLIEFAFPLH